ncbi:MAG: hypothetical protein H5U02_00430 [Clostridia bacterium]|nr:hypothetical protein [Clostridia bacterium]
MRGWRRLRIPPDVQKMLEPGAEAYLFGECTVIVGRSEGAGWHLSISHPTRYPTWSEIRDARYRFIPDEVTMAMFLPPKREYVNVDKNCFHLFEVHVERGGVAER